MEDVSLARFAFAFIFVLGLIGISALLARRFGGKLMLPTATKEGRIRVVPATTPEITSTTALPEVPANDTTPSDPAPKKKSSKKKAE